MSAIKLEILPGEYITIGNAVITLVEKSGRRARLEISAPEDVQIRHSKQDDEYEQNYLTRSESLVS